MKKKRQDIILQIIEEQDVETQYDLITALRAKGFDSTQATISRDIKELALVKELSPRGVYRYCAGSTSQERDYSSRLKTIFRECVTSSDVARNLVVLRTLPGLAGAACAAIDGMALRSYLGSVAGDDTAFLAMSDDLAAMRLNEEIAQMIR